MNSDLQETAVAVEKNENGGGNGNAAEHPSAPDADKEAVPFMRRVVENMERTFDEWHRWGWPVPPAVPLPRAFWSREGADWMPRIEVLEQNGDFVVRAELPGLRREDISVEVSDGYLMLSGTREEKKEEKENGYYRSERSYGKFFRSVPLPEGVTGEEAKAEFRDGLLEVRLAVPQREENRRRIEVG